MNFKNIDDLRSFWNGGFLVKKLCCLLGICFVLLGCRAPFVEPAVPIDVELLVPTKTATPVIEETATPELEEPIRFYIDLTFVDSVTKEPVVADVILFVDDDGDDDPETKTMVAAPCTKATSCAFSIPVDGYLYLYMVFAEGYEPHSLGIRPFYTTEKRLSGEVPLKRIVPEEGVQG